MTGKTAIIGNGESILAFKAGGVDAFPCENSAEARTVLKKKKKKKKKKKMKKRWTTF